MKILAFVACQRFTGRDAADFLQARPGSDARRRRRQSGQPATRRGADRRSRGQRRQGDCSAGSGDIWLDAFFGRDRSRRDSRWTLLFNASRGRAPTAGLRLFASHQPPNKSNCGGGPSFCSLSRSARWRAGGRTLPSGVSSDSSRLRRISLARSSTVFGTPARRATWMP